MSRYLLVAMCLAICLVAEGKKPLREYFDSIRNEPLQCVDDICSPVASLEERVQQAKENVVFLTRVLTATRFAKDDVIEQLIQQYRDIKLQGKLIDIEALDRLEKSVTQVLNVAKSHRQVIEDWASDALELVQECATLRNDINIILKLVDIGALTPEKEFVKAAKECKTQLENEGFTGRNVAQYIPESTKRNLESILEYLNSMKASVDIILDKEVCFDKTVYQTALAETLGITESEAGNVIEGGLAERDAKVGARCIRFCILLCWCKKRKRRSAVYASVKDVFGVKQKVEVQNHMIVKLAEYRKNGDFCATPREVFGLEYTSENACLLPFKYLLKDVFADVNEELKSLTEVSRVIPQTSTPSLPDMDLFEIVLEPIRASATAKEAAEILDGMPEQCKAKFQDNIQNEDELKQCVP